MTETGLSERKSLNRAKARPGHRQNLQIQTNAQRRMTQVSEDSLAAV